MQAVHNKTTEIGEGVYDVRDVLPKIGQVCERRDIRAYPSVRPDKLAKATKERSTQQNVREQMAGAPRQPVFANQRRGLQHGCIMAKLVNDVVDEFVRKPTLLALSCQGHGTMSHGSTPAK